MAQRSPDPYENFVLSPFFSFLAFFVVMVIGMAAIVGFATLVGR